jgi:hypothetical protein
MVIEDLIVEKLRALPPEKKQEVLDFVEFLEHRRTTSQERASPEGLWAGLDISLNDEDIAEVRREMWQRFPREDA